MESTQTFEQQVAIKALKQYYDNELGQRHLKDLLADDARNAGLFLNSEQGKFGLDFTHTKLDLPAFKLLGEVAQDAQVFPKIKAMFAGEKINNTEGRSVLHTALRLPKDASLVVDGTDVVKDVHGVLDRIAQFSNKVRDGTFAGFTGKRLKNIVAIGIGGSFLGPEFVFEALKHDATCKAASAEKGMQLKFLANVDPIDFYRATDGLDVEETLFVIVSKTFTTAETMLNARTCRKHILDHYAKAQPGCDTAQVLAAHLCAVSTNLAATKDFGISDENVFGFWSWVGGRYSVSSAVGVLPLSLYYGFENVQAFLSGMHDIDKNFSGETDYTKNVPVLMGLLGFYNSHVAGHASRAILPYC
jgi:glucose-6-phosphate isomerase